MSYPCPPKLFRPIGVFNVKHRFCSLLRWPTSPVHLVWWGRVRVSTHIYIYTTIVIVALVQVILLERKSKAILTTTYFVKGICSGKEINNIFFSCAWGKPSDHNSIISARSFAFIYQLNHFARLVSPPQNANNHRCAT